MRRYLTALAAFAAAATLLAGCGGAPGASSAGGSPTPASADAGWPRTIEHAAGSTTIEARPVRIVSTSPSVTGSLLAIDAPLVASAATAPSALTDERGFFTQWAQVAQERKVEVLYANLELDLDAIDLFEPDLIIGSVNGGDATRDAYAQLSDIAPTVLVDYGTVTWQDLTTTLGKVTGLEDKAAATVASYDTWVAVKAKEVKQPVQPVTALVYLGADGIWAFGDSSPQAQLLTSLGFTYQALPKDLLANQMPGANGVDIVTAENMPAALAQSQTLFPVALGGRDPVATLKAEPLLANQPAIASGRVYSMGAEAFRLDYYSARNTVELLVKTLGS